MVFKEKKVARRVLRQEEILLKGARLIRLVKFVSITDIKNKLGVMATEKLFPGEDYFTFSVGHTQEEIEMVNRLKKSLWKRLYDYISDGPGTKVTDDVVADIY